MPPQQPQQPARRRTVALLLALLVTVAALSGCARVRTALAVQTDDTVVGEIVVATPAQGEQDTGPEVTVPAGLADDVAATPYAQDGYVGSVLRFSDLTFEQVGLLSEAGGPAGDRVSIDLRRAGGRVLVSGSADLTTVEVDRADFQLKISFPGQVVETNGDVDSGTVSWVFVPGEVGGFSAVVAFDDPGAPSAINWTLFLATIVALAVAAVVVLARRTRNPPVSPPVR